MDLYLFPLFLRVGVGNVKALPHIGRYVGFFFTALVLGPLFSKRTKLTSRRYFPINTKARTVPMAFRFFI